MQRSAKLQKREIRVIKSMKMFNATQRGSARKRNTTQKRFNKTRHSAEVQEREIREIKFTKRLNAMQRRSARKRNKRKKVKVNTEVQRNAAQHSKREKSEK